MIDVNTSLDQLLDCLDYAPEGVISLVKNMAVDMKLNDVSKRDAIKDKTGFDVSKKVFLIISFSVIPSVCLFDI